MPRVGAIARIIYFSGAVEQATVLAVDDEGKRLRVRDETGATVEFVLNRASARFLLAGAPGGPRLELAPGTKMGERGLAV
jgi:hypothetical protein